MARPGPKLKGPTTEKEFKIFENLAHIQCTLEEIAACFGVTKDTLILRVEEYYGARFSTVYKEKREGGKTSLRRAQWIKAVEEKNTTMQIFLGKQYLGQVDRPEELIQGMKSIVYSTQIGPSGEILTEIRNKEDWDAQKNFDAKKVLEGEQTKTTKAKSKSKPKKVSKKKVRAK